MSMLEHGLEMALEGVTRHPRSNDGADQRQAYAMAIALIILLGRNRKNAGDDIMRDVTRFIALRKQPALTQDDVVHLNAVCCGLEGVCSNGIATVANGRIHERRIVSDQMPP